MKFFGKKELSPLDMEILEITRVLRRTSPDSEEYVIIAKSLEQLYKTKEGNKSWKISPDTVAIIAANLIGLVLILTFEKTDIITSKAIGFVMKTRL